MLDPDIRLRTLTTAAMTQAEHDALRALLSLAFEGDFAESDWQHALGGLHVLAQRGEQLLGHAALVERALTCNARSLRTGYVEALAVHPSARRRGVASALMERVERAIVAGFELGALSATELSAPLYAKRGWLVWRGALGACTERGIELTPDEQGGIFVFAGSIQPDLDSSLVADARSGDVW